MEEARLASTVKEPCTNCGGEMRFDAKDQALRCANCGTVKAIATAQDRIVETSLTLDNFIHDAATGLDTPTHIYACNNCGAQTSVALDQVEAKCSFCGSASVNEQAFDQRTIRPFGLIPFKIVQKDAQARFKDWIGQGWFHPSKLKKLAELKELNGIYVPFWTFDADTYSRWTAESGYHYYVTVDYTDSNGNRQTRQEQRTRWAYSSGDYSYQFDDVTVVASKGLQQGLVEWVYPYSLHTAVNYDPKFLLGWKSEVYAVDVKQGFGIASDIMDNHLRNNISRQVPGDTHRNLDIDTEKSNLTFKHLLLPLWVAAYQYNGKTYQVLVNGETGKITGNKPLDWLKITLLILVVLAVVAVVVWLNQKG